MLKITHILYSGLGGTSDVCQILCKLDKEINSRSSLIQVGPKKFSNSINSLYEPFVQDEYVAAGKLFDVSRASVVHARRHHKLVWSNTV